MVLKVLIVDDEALARSRLRNLLAQCGEPAVTLGGEAANAAQALALLQRERFDVVLLDIHMPGSDGLALAAALRELPEPPATVFVTAQTGHALQAFELDAADYLTKPVRLERLQAALVKAQRLAPARAAAGPVLEPPLWLLIQDRGRTERVPVAEVLYLKAELKYVTVRTATRSYILDGALSELEALYANQFLRVHRNALVARHAVRALEKSQDPQEGEIWAVRLSGLDERLAVSRRQLAAVRDALAVA